MQISPGWQRAIAATIIVPTAALSLPVAAMFLDHPEGRENWILPAQAAGAGGIGAAVGASLPRAFGSQIGRGGAAAIGAGVALGVAAIADIALFTAMT